MFESLICNKFIWYRPMSLLSACAYLGCGQTCIDGMFGYKQCACYKDFRLNPDNRTCSHIGKSFTCNRGHSVLCKMLNNNQQSKKIAVERSVIKIFIHWRKQTLWITSVSCRFRHFIDIKDRMFTHYRSKSNHCNNATNGQLPPVYFRKRKWCSIYWISNWVSSPRCKNYHW